MRPGYPTVASATPLQTRSGPVLRVHLSGQEVLAGGDGQGEDVVSADRGEPAAGRAAPQTQSGSARLVRLLPARLFVGDLLLPEPVPVVWRWLRRKHRRSTWKELRRDYCRGGWWPSGQDLELFDPEKVGTTRYRYRGSIIPTPWPISGPLVGDAHPVRAGLVESPVH